MKKIQVSCYEVSEWNSKRWEFLPTIIFENLRGIWYGENYTRNFNDLKLFASEAVLCGKMQMKVFLLLIGLSYAAKQSKNVAESDGNNGTNKNDGELILVKIEEEENAKVLI